MFIVMFQWWDGSDESITGVVVDDPGVSVKVCGAAETTRNKPVLSGRGPSRGDEQWPAQTDPRASAPTPRLRFYTPLRAATGSPALGHQHTLPRLPAVEVTCDFTDYGPISLTSDFPSKNSTYLEYVLPNIAKKLIFCINYHRKFTNRS